MAKLYTKKTWVDEVLSGAERYRIADNADTTLQNNVIIELLTGVLTAGDVVNAANMNNIENGIDAIDTRVENLKYALNRIVTLTSGTTFTPTSGARALLVECIGGGGAGGGAETSSSNCSLGGGGGGGGYSAALLTGTLKASYAYQVGAGGTAGSAGAAGNAGGDTTFDSPSVCTAKGGSGGAVLAAGTSLLTQNGADGGAASSGVGDVKLDGSQGGWGVRLSASAGHAGDGGSAPRGGGNVGGANATLTAGSAGKLYGGGGSGAFTATTSRAGGAGAQGMIRIWEFL